MRFLNSFWSKFTSAYFRFRLLFFDKKIWLVGVLVLVLFLVLFPYFSSAQAPPPPAAGMPKVPGAGLTLRFLAFAVTLVAYVLLWFFGIIFGWVFQMDVSGFLNSDLITVGWTITRDTANIAFIIILLVIAFGTVLRIPALEYRVLLAPLLLAVILVNFSRTICIALAEIGDILVRTFIPLAQSRNIPATLLGGLGFQRIWQVFGTGLVTDWHEVITMVFVAGYVCIALGAFIAVSLFFIIRLIGMGLLTIFAPLAFVAWVLPGTKKYNKMWWDKYMDFLMYGPIAAFLIMLAGYLAGKVIIDSVATMKGLLGEPPMDITQPPATQTYLVAAINPAQFIGYIMICGILWAAVVMGKSVGGQLSGAIMGLAKGAAGFIPRQLGKFIGAQLALGRRSALGRFLTTGKGAAIGRLAGKVFAPVRKAITPMMAMVNRVREAMGKPTAERAKDRIEENKDLTAAEVEGKLSRSIRQKDLRGNIFGDMVSLEQKDPGSLRRAMATNRAFTDLLTSEEKEKFKGDLDRGIAGDEMYTTIMNKLFGGEALGVMDKLGQVSRATKDFSLYGMTKFNPDTEKIELLSKEARHGELMDKIGKLKDVDMPHVSEQLFLDIDLVKRIHDTNPDLEKKILEHGNDVTQKQYRITLEKIPLPFAVPVGPETPPVYYGPPKPEKRLPAIPEEPKKGLPVILEKPKEKSEGPSSE